MAGRFSVEGAFRAVDQMTRPISRIQRSLDRFQRTAATGFRDLSGFATAFRTGFLAVGAVIASVAAAGVAAFRELIDTGMEFDQVMATMGSRFSTARGAEEFRALEQAAIDASTRTGVTAIEAGNALAELGAAGANAAEAIQQLPIVLDTAAAGTISLAEAGDTITDVMSAFGMTMADATENGRQMQRTADVMVRGANSSSQSFQQLRGAIVNAQTAAHAAGADIETTTAMLMAMAQAGEKGERAGTRLGTMFTDLMTPSSVEATRALRRLHINTRDGAGNMRDMVDIVGQFERAFVGMDNATRDAALHDIFGQDGMRPMLQMLNTGSAGLQAFRADLQNAAGSTAAMAETMRDNGAVDVAIMTAEIEALKLEMWAFIRGPVREVVQGITSWVRANEGIISGGFGDAVAFITAHMEELKMVGLGLAVVFGTIAVVVGLISVLFLGTAAAILLAVSAVVGGILYGLGWLWENASGVATSIGEAFTSAWDSIVEFFTPAIEFIVGAFAILRARAMRELQPVFDFLGRAAGVVRGVFAQIAGLVGSIWSSVSSEGSSAFNSLYATVRPVVLGIQSAFTQLGNAISNVWYDAAHAFEQTLDPIMERLLPFIDAVRQVGRAEMDEDERPRRPARQQVISPEDRAARAISETRSTERAEVVIRDETRRAQVTQRPRRTARTQLRQARSGAL